MVIFGVGSNIGDRLAYLNQAATGLGEIITDIKISPVYESLAVLPENAPESWNMSFLNAAISGKTSLTPHQLLQFIKLLERKIGRTENYQKWSPRIIDIDILAMDDLMIDEENLKIPHPHLLERPFALLPFADIAPDWQYPGKNIAVCEFARESGNIRRTAHTISL